jgi:hypothetical protein
MTLALNLFGWNMKNGQESIRPTGCGIRDEIQKSKALFLILRNIVEKTHKVFKVHVNLL